MGRGIRHFLVDDTEVRPISDRVLHDLREGEGRLPSHAGRDLRLLDLTVDVRDGAPVEVRDVVTSTLPLDDRGRVKSQLYEQLQASLRRIKPKPPWRPSPMQLERATALALGRAKSKRRALVVLREKIKK